MNELCAFVLEHKNSHDVKLITSDAKCASEAQLCLPNSTVHVSTCDGLKAHGCSIVVFNDCLIARNMEHIMETLLCTMPHNAVLLLRQNLANTKWTMASLTQYLEQFSVNDGDQRLSLKMSWVKQMECAIKSEPLTDENKNHVSVRDFLDKTQYQEDGIAAYEKIFGAGFISPGGAEQNLYFLNMLQPKAGQTMLDVGVGIGGSAVQCAQKFGCDVLGIDLSSNMLNIALERLQANPDKRIRYMLADVMTYDFGEGQFDIVYSRDCIQHIGDKKTLYSRLYRYLKPGGQLLTTGYTAGSGEFTAKFQAYLKARQYGLKPATEYVESCQSAGFSSVEYTDLTPKFREILLKEIEYAEKHKEQFIQNFGDKKYADLLDGWRSKITYIDAKNHCWTMIRCTK